MTVWMTAPLGTLNGTAEQAGAGRPSRGHGPHKGQSRAPQRLVTLLPDSRVGVTVGDSTPTGSWGSKCSSGCSGSISKSVPHAQLQESDKKLVGTPAMTQLLNSNYSI